MVDSGIEEKVAEARKRSVVTASDVAKETLQERMRFTMEEFEIAGVKLRIGDYVVVEIRARKYEPIAGKIVGYNPLIGVITIETEKEYKIVRLRDIKVITVPKKKP